MNKKKQKILLEKILNNESINFMANEINRIHPGEISEIIEQLPDNRRFILWDIIIPKLKGEILLEVHDEVKKQLISITNEKDLIATVSELQLDEIADLDENLPENVVEAIIQQMDIQKRKDYESIKSYPNDTAGGLMDLDYIAIRSDVTINVALRYIKFLRSKYKALPEHLDCIYLIDMHEKFIGSIKITDLISLHADTLLKNITNESAITVSDMTIAKKVAKIFENHDLISIPVINDKNKLLGRITIDDIVDVIRKEGEKLIMRPAGLSEKTDIFGPIRKTVKYRVIWNGLNLINAFISAFVISLFVNSIDKIVSLAVLMPVIASMGGVAGNQSLTLVTRGIALDQITKENKYLLFRRELLTGFLNGFIWAIVVSLITYVWLNNLLLSIVFGVSLLLSLMLSATAGTLIPIILTRLKIDPALAGSVLLVAISDVAGFFIFLSIATIILI